MAGDPDSDTSIKTLEGSLFYSEQGARNTDAGSLRGLQPEDSEREPASPIAAFQSPTPRPFPPGATSQEGTGLYI